MKTNLNLRKLSIWTDILEKFLHKHEINVNCHRKKKLEHGKSMQRNLVKMQHVDLVLHNFWPFCQNCIFEKQTENYSLSSLEILIMFPNILRCFAISSLKSQKEILFKVFLRCIRSYATYDKSNLLMKLSKIQKNVMIMTAWKLFI